jgi:hypothetical protein
MVASPLRLSEYSSVPNEAGNMNGEMPAESEPATRGWRRTGSAVETLQSVLIVMLIALLAYTTLSGSSSSNCSQCSEPQLAPSTAAVSDSVGNDTAPAAAPSADLTLPVCPAPVFVGDPGYLAPSEEPKGCEQWRFGRYSLKSVTDAAPPSSYPKHVYDIHTFLISFPRSGNSMTRKILEDGTGVVTGTVYNDKGLSKAGFQGEMQTNGVLLIKHHFIRFGNSPGFALGPLHDAENPSGQYAVERYVYIIRNPMDAMVSFFQKQRLKSHVGQLENIPLAAFTQFILTWLPIWAAHVRFFTATFLQERCPHCEFMLARYEDFINHKRGTMLNPADRMLCFLGYSPDRGCRPETVAGDHSAGVTTYKLKDRRSLFNHSLVLPRNVSYAEEVFSYLSEDEIHRIELEAGLEMKAHGYWPYRSYY